MQCGQRSEEDRTLSRVLRHLGYGPLLGIGKDSFCDAAGEALSMPEPMGAWPNARVYRLRSCYPPTLLKTDFSVDDTALRATWFFKVDTYPKDAAYAALQAGDKVGWHICHATNADEGFLDTLRSDLKRQAIGGPTTADKTRRCGAVARAPHSLYQRAAHSLFTAYAFTPLGRT